MYFYLNNMGEEFFTVGFYEPDGNFQPESDHKTAELAAARVNYLNGGSTPDANELLTKFKPFIDVLLEKLKFELKL